MSPRSDAGLIAAAHKVQPMRESTDCGAVQFDVVDAHEVIATARTFLAAIDALF